MENEGITGKKNKFILPYENTSIEVSGDFDSGNLNSACINLEKQVLTIFNEGNLVAFWKRQRNQAEF